MDPRTLFKKALEQATATVSCVQEHHFKNDTPCTDWNCRTLVNHMLYELSWVPDMLAGKTVKEVGNKYEGDLLGDDHTDNWHKAADKAIEAVNTADLNQIVHLSYGDVPASHYIQEVGSDLYIHAWDAAQSFKCSLVMEDDMAQAVRDGYYQHKEDLTKSGFEEAIEIPENSRLQTKLLALLGRREPAV